MDSGSSAFMLVCTMLVLLMTPGLAFFYGGLSRRKNVGNTMVMVFVVIGIVAVTWTVCGWSLAYGGDGENPVFGGFDQLLLLGNTAGMLLEAQSPADAVYPSLVDVVFQMAFCIDHHGHHHRRRGRAHEVRRRGGLPGRLDGAGLSASGPYGLGRRRVADR